MPKLTAQNASKVIAAGRGVLEAREALEGQSLADMYASGMMNPRLLSAHDALDRALDRVLAPRRRITTEVDRLAVLFELYERITTEGQLTV